MVVVTGFIARDPEEETAPTSLPMVTVVALETDQLKVDTAPADMLEGLALKLLMTGYDVGGVVGAGQPLPQQSTVTLILKLVLAPLSSATVTVIV